VIGTTLKERFTHYLRGLHEAYGGRDDATEHTGRTALELLLRSFAADISNGPSVTHEPKRIAGKGAPDFKFSKAGMIVGYVEAKAPGTPLRPLFNDDQIKRYIQLSPNLVLTDYLTFVHIREGKPGKPASLCNPADLDSPNVQVRSEQAAEVAALLTAALSTPPIGIGAAIQLAEALAVRARLLRDAMAGGVVPPILDQAFRRSWKAIDCRRSSASMACPP
jgi:hypothetical protein